MRSGRKSEAQTPSPKKDRIYGSKTNPKGSASSSKEASNIKFTESTIKTLENKRDEYNAKHPNKKVTLATLKAVFRRGAGAFSSSHRPNMTRSGWAFARVNKFLLKKGGTKVKAAYVQDDDLMERGGVIKKQLEGTLTKLGREKYIVKGDYKNQANHTRELKNILSSKGLKEYSYEISPSTKSYYLEYANDKCEISIRLSNHTKASIFDDGEYEFIDSSVDKNGYLRAEIYICSNEDFEDAKKWIQDNIQDDDLMERGGEITWNEYVKTQFDENENRYLPENYFEEFTIQEGKKEDYPTILKEKDGLEYRKWKYGGIGVFDENKKVGFADNGSIQVSPLYQKRGIGIELVSLLKELNPSHRFGNMTPQGWNLMRSYYNKKVANRYDYDDNGGEIGQEITCRGCGWSWNTTNSDEHDKYVCHKCKVDNRKYYDSDPIGKYHLGGDMSKHLAPNGKPSNLTHEQWHLVRTPEFKAWFGDWENDPANASKVVDENGEPLVVYHGTSDKLFYEFMPFAIDYYNGQAIKEYRGDRTNEEFDEYIKKYGLRKIPTRFWFSTKHLWGDKFLACFLNIRNMFITDEYEPKLPTDYNGFRVPNEDGIDYYSVSKSEQIKLADGSNTTFDGNNPDIRYEDGGKLKKPHTTLEIAKKHKVSVSEIMKSLREGIKAEKEHTNDAKFARTIALHHLWESPKYYDKLKKMEKSFKNGGYFSDRYPKNEYIQLSNDDIYDFKEDIFNIINSSYAYIGGHIEFQKPDDIVNSDLNFWIGADVDEDPELDTIIGGKRTKYGTKLTSSAQDGSRYAKISVMRKLGELLNTKGFYAETNLDLAQNRGIDWEKDENIIRKVVDKSDIVMNEDGSYTRSIGGHPHTKVLVGYFDHLKEKNYKRGGELDPDNKGVKDYFAGGSGSTGGVLVGKRHNEGGIKAINKATNTPIEMEGGEVVITRKAVSDNTKREFEGQMLTNKEILSKINEGGGGVSFRQGGKVGTHRGEENYGDINPSELNKRLFPNAYKKKYKNGGQILGTISIVNKQLPTLGSFKNSYKGLAIKPIKNIYKDFLKEQYGVNFDELPKKIQLGITLGNQKLIDNYINS